MNAFFVGGPLDKFTLQLASCQDQMRWTEGDGAIHSYREYLGRTFSIEHRGNSTDENALYFHQELWQLSPTEMLEHCEQRGL